MPLSDSDRESIELQIIQQVQKNIEASLDGIVDRATVSTLADERIKLFSAQLKDQVEAKVSASLTARYTWIGLVTAALIGGGSAGVTSLFVAQFNKQTIDSLNENLATFKVLNGELTDMKAKSRSTIDQITEIERRALQAQQTFDSTNTAISSLQNTVVASTELLKATTSTLQVLSKNFEDVQTGKKTSAVVSADDAAKLATSVKSTAARADAVRFRVFLHFGSVTLRQANEAAILAVLRDAGYIVVGQDISDDDKGGSGIDYFYPADCAGAAAIQALVMGALPTGAAEIPLRQQSVYNRPGTIGIWISSKPPVVPSQSCKA
jgi:hypothetical protein